MLGAVPQQGADNVPEGQGQSFSSHNRLKKRPRNRNYTPAVCSRTRVNYINCTLLGFFAKYRLCSLLWKARISFFSHLPFTTEYNIKSHTSKNKFKVSRDTGKTGFCLFDIQYSIRLTTSFGIHYMIQENLIIFLGNKQKKPNHLHFCNRAKCISH